MKYKNKSIYKQMVKRRIYSFPNEGESRADAICRIFRQYTLVDWALYDKVSFKIVSSVAHPLLMGELNRLMAVTQSFMASAKVKVTHEVLAGNERKLLLVIHAYKDGNE